MISLVRLYNRNFSQIVLVSLVCFLCPGMFNALSGLGGGGQVSATVANNANVALYTTFSVFGFFAGSITNTIGPRFSLSFGGIGYALYAASLLCYDHTSNEGFVIFAGAWLGMCAGLLWAAQGMLILSYPEEKQKGRALALFWAIFNSGAVIGSLVPLIQNLHSTADSVNDGTYAAFIALMACGAILGLFIAKPENVRRGDGSSITLMRNPTWRTELLGLWECLKSDRAIIWLFPMFFASNWFYTYQFNDFNLALFNIRTRALNNLMYWAAQIFGAACFGFFLDWSRFRRSTRARCAWLFITILTCAIWFGTLPNQLEYTRDSLSAVKLDWTNGALRYGTRLFLYILYGMFDAVWQCYVYWLMGAFSNNARKLAFYAGFYKGIQSAGAAIIYRLDALELPYLNLWASSTALLLAGLIFAIRIVFFKVTDHTEDDEDIVKSSSLNGHAVHDISSEELHAEKFEPVERSIIKVDSR